MEVPACAGGATLEHCDAVVKAILVSMYRGEGEEEEEEEESARVASAQVKPLKKRSKTRAGGKSSRKLIS